ncbi:MAG TPA: preprotein translocase subunit YajC [Chryseolinea sp.]|nr:preprotein translocase subunit YajC [Chryseolinea sp.]
MHPILAQAQTGNSTYMPFFILAFAVIFYFFMIRPQQKKQKEAKKFIEELKKGDYVVTIGGAHGYIGEMEGDTFILEVEKGGRIKFNKSAISAEATKVANKK